MDGTTGAVAGRGKLARVDVNILKEIARVVQSRAKVPDRIQLLKRTFLITYLDDHRQRIEEALRRHDPDRLNMLFGQLESKVKYQVVRGGQKQAASRSSRETSRSKSTSSIKTKARKVAKKARPGTSTSKKAASPAARGKSKSSTSASKKATKATKGAASKTRKAPKRQAARKRGR